MKYLSLVCMNDLFSANSNHNMMLSENYQKVEFSIKEAEVSLIALSATSFFYCLCAIVYFLIYHLFKDKAIFVLNLIEKIYDGMMFPLSLGLIYPFFLIRGTLSERDHT